MKALPLDGAEELGASATHFTLRNVLSGSWLLNTVTAGTEEPNPAQGEAAELGLCVWSPAGKQRSRGATLL